MSGSSASQNSYDLAIAGGGLAGGLIAVALQELRPELDVALIEAEDRFGGSHIWSFFDSDVDPENKWLVEPLISRHWDSYDVHFPEFSRSIANGYNSIESANFDSFLREKLPKSSLITGKRISCIGDGLVKLEKGEDIAAKAVIDVRGGGNIDALEFGWQKFFGQMLKLHEPHGLERPVIMDATVDQSDGYRFVYCLPFGEKQIFVEDTYYSDTRDLDPDALRASIAGYAADQEWHIDAIVSEEHGQLPVIYGGDFRSFWKENDGPDARAGTRAALIQPITSYSLPMAVQSAVLIAKMPDITQSNLDEALKDMATKHWKSGKFYRMLCAFLFKGADPDKRYLTLQHTYSKDEDLLARFYAGKTTRRDQAALLSGKPPIPIRRALPLMMKYR
ncbi:lycopene beta-cyclase [Parasphingorhabdus marina DSM 22363]|uniref:Lycopene beta-cyclase n=1 Tax=Parasphingorhabdus marina DSM 22363 TaxID=1123272 RepID=A0A1N6EQD5_9SPHN|nr:lycopene beta-cyclase CrtY [Parasphingorhabdus marina]SIN85200.1 lycopene beta-cyclase [Parasphingorhabdus marina DSM 22363]